MDSSDSELGTTGAPPTPPMRNCWLPPCLREAAAALEVQVADAGLCDADLAEADQSHEANEGRGSQAEGAATPDAGAAPQETAPQEQQPTVSFYSLK